MSTTIVLIAVDMCRWHIKKNNLKIPHIQEQQVCEEVDYEIMFSNVSDILCTDLNYAMRHKLRMCQ